MKKRCPSSPYVGIARLRGYKWIINARGYANVVEASGSSTSCSSSNEHNHVWGLVYSLTAKDEAQLDVNEGVPDAYTKEKMTIDFFPADPSQLDGRIDIPENKWEKRKVLVYIDRKRTTNSTPKKEYIYRMNMGIKDALKMGVPKTYVDKVIRKFIPEEDVSAEVEETAKKQAVQFIDENE